MIHINIKQRDIPVELILKRSNKRISLRVKEKVVYITTPRKLIFSEIEEMIARHFCFIMKHMNEQKKIDNQIHLLGKLYSLTIVSANKNQFEVKEDTILLMVNSSKAVEMLVQKLYKMTLIKIVEEYKEKMISLFDAPTPIEFQYKKVKTYYGECFPTKKRIILATHLAKYDLKYILSVICHEFAHFKYFNHQKEFYDYLEERFPNYKQVQKELKRITYNERY